MGPPGPGPAQVFERIYRDIRSFNLKWVFPYDAALQGDLIKNPTVYTMLVFGLLPLAVLVFNVVTDAQGVARMFTIYCALAWAAYFYYFVAQRSVDWRLGVACMAATAFLFIRVVMIDQTFPPFSWIYPMTERPDVVSKLLGYVFGVGLNEELFKAAPVLILAYGFKRVEKPIDGVFMGALSGLGFAITEGEDYILKHGNIIQVLIRSTTLPFLHALWSGIAGYFIALAMINRSRGPALIILGIGVAAVTHGAYDTFIGYAPLIGLFLGAFVYLLFMTYLQRSQDMVTQLQQAEREAAERERLEQMMMAQGFMAPAWPGGPPPVPAGMPPGMMAPGMMPGFPPGSAGPPPGMMAPGYPPGAFGGPPGPGAPPGGPAGPGGPPGIPPGPPPGNRLQ